jgi:hypothetical protein
MKKEEWAREKNIFDKKKKNWSLSSPAGHPSPGLNR